jgi:hypothetical protein
VPRDDKSVEYGARSKGLTLHLARYSSATNDPCIDWLLWRWKCKVQFGHQRSMYKLVTVEMKPAVSWPFSRIFPSNCVLLEIEYFDIHIFVYITPFSFRYFPNLIVIDTLMAWKTFMPALNMKLPHSCFTKCFYRHS